MRGPEFDRSTDVDPRGWDARLSIPGSPVWVHVADGDGGDCAVNRTTPATCFHTYFGMSPERSTPWLATPSCPHSPRTGSAPGARW